MDLDATDRRLLGALEDGLPLSAAPYAALGATLKLSEGQVLSRLRRLLDRGVIGRFGLVVKHRELGYRANAMVVWDIPDTDVAAVAQRLIDFPFVTLCYQRPRRLPDWPYNLFCMIHGRDRETVEAQIRTLIREADLKPFPTTTLFSRRAFKQRGARYCGPAAAVEDAA